MASLLLGCNLVMGQEFTSSAENDAQLLPVEKGWAKNSINAVVFRQSSVISYQDSQYLAYYNDQGEIILGKRNLGDKNWETYKTQYSANVEDAHNSISLGIDGEGKLHVAWGMHGDSLKYAQSLEPEGLTLSSRLSMVGTGEDKVTYPRFYRLNNGDLLFMYRYGSSGSGDIKLNHFDKDTGEWENLHDPLIDGEGERNAYMNGLAIDAKGGWHISWTWRESWDVATNHDILYAYSPDEGKTWVNTYGEAYELPITADADIAYHIPQKSELINQTSMTVTASNEPVIATYWKAANDEAPQFYLVSKEEGQWNAMQVGKRSLDFSLSGGGTKRIPISRPQILAGANDDLYLVFRDFERGGGITVASSMNGGEQWNFHDVYSSSIGLWEPTFDSHAWEKNKELYLFGQYVGQGDGEQTEDLEPQQVFLLKWIPSKYQ